MPGARFFPDAQAQFRREPACAGAATATALVFRGEDKVDAAHELGRSSKRWCRGCSRRSQAAGVGEGDRVAAMLPNLPEAIALMLAVTSLGAILSSCSPDFGERGVLDRFGQIEPKMFIAVDGYWYNGKRISIAEKLRHIAAQSADARPRSSSFPISATRTRSQSNCRAASTLDAFLDAVRAEAAALRAAAVRSPDLHSLFVRHDRRAEMHRAWRRRHAAAASEGAPPALRRARGERLFYFTTLRLDDVELARLRARERRHADALRRLAVRAGARACCSTTRRTRKSRCSAPRRNISTPEKGGPGTGEDARSCRRCG